MEQNQQHIDVSIIIVNYNTHKYILDCLESVFKETSNINIEVIVLDNGSQDGSADVILRCMPNVHLIVSKENLGFAQGNNLAAQNAKGEYILLLNPDTVVIDRAVERLFAFAKANPIAGIYGGRTIFPDGTLNPDFCYRKMTPWSLFCRAFGLTILFKNTTFFNPETYGSWNYDSVREVDIITGCFFLVKTDLWHQLKGFNPLFFMFGEEVDFCLRAKKLGHNPLFTPDATIIHYSGASEPVKANSFIKTLCSHSTNIREHWPKSQVNFGVSMLIVRVGLKTLVLNILSAIGVSKFNSQAVIWTEAWRQRKEWIDGWYPEAENCVRTLNNHE